MKINKELLTEEFDRMLGMIGSKDAAITISKRQNYWTFFAHTGHSSCEMFNKIEDLETYLNKVDKERREAIEYRKTHEILFRKYRG